MALLDNNPQATQAANATYAAANPNVFGSGVQRYTQPTPTQPTPAPTQTQTPALSTNDYFQQLYNPAPQTTPSNGLQTLDQFSAQREGNVDENAIRDQVTKSMQSQIDATNSYYADLINQQGVTNENNSGKTRATDARSGLLGSDFGNAHAANQETANNKATKAIQDEQASKIAGIHSQIDSLANQEIAAKRAQAVGDADAYSKYLTTAQTQANDTLKQLASAGTDLSQLDPQRKAYLYQAAGLDPSIGDLVYNSMKPGAAQLNYKYIQQADGSTLAIAPDPKNPGQFIQTTIPGASPDIGLLLGMIKQYPDAGITPQDDLATASQKIQASPSYQTANNKPVSLAQGDMLIDPKTGKQIAYNPKTATPTTDITGGGTGGTGGSTGVVPGVSTANGSGPNGAITQNDTTNFWAQAASSGVSQDSLLPSLGMGAAAVAEKVAILNKIAANAITLGIDGQTFGAMLTDSRAKQKAYSTLQAQGSQTQVNEQTASSYFDTLGQLAEKVDATTFKTGAPILDGWIRNGTLAVTGDQNINNFMSQMTEALTEYAKVMSGQTTGAGVDASARAAAQGLLQKGFSASTIKSFIGVAKQNMSDRTSSYNNALKGLFGDIQNVQSSSGGLGGSDSGNQGNSDSNSNDPLGLGL